jgi:sortase A
MSIITPSSAHSRDAEEQARLDDRAATEGHPRWRPPKGALAIATLALVGSIVFLYPSTASWVSQYHQSQIVVDLGEQAAISTPDDRQTALAAAHAYNEALISSATLPANSRKPASSGQGADEARYLSLLNGDANGAMGRLRIGKIDVDLPIYHGTDDVTLTKGVGHLEGTSLPVGGGSTHSVLTAHRGYAEATLFDRLDELASGDTFTVEVFGEVLTYQVIETKVVEPTDTESLFPRYGKDLMTLVTCTPLGINSHRILVTGERVLPTPAADIDAAGAKPDIPGFPWWAAGLGATVCLLGAYVWRSGRPGSRASA